MGLAPVQVRTRQLWLEFFVIQKDTNTITHTQQVGVVLGQLVDGLNLLIQEMLFQIIRKVRIIVPTGNFVQIQ